MSSLLVEKLLESFDELDRCICVTQEVLKNKPEVPASVVARVSQYSDIVAKQRGYAKTLREKITENDWVEVGRLVKIINGLSAMIRDDAQAILSGAYESIEPDTKNKELFC